MLSKKFFIKKINTTPDKIINLDGGGYQMDLKHMVKSKEGYNYILVLVSTHTNECDVYPMFNKTMQECVTGLKQMLKRKYIRSIGNITHIGVDKGSEFVNSMMKNFLLSKNIELIVENTTVHINSTAIVERAISSITKDVMNYLQQKRYETKNQNYNDWIPVLQHSVFKINNERRLNPKTYKTHEVVQEMPKIKNIIRIGTVVYPFLTTPKHVVSEQNKYKFRNADIRYDANNPSIVSGYFMRHSRPLRYILDDNNKVTYNRHELLSETEI